MTFETGLTFWPSGPYGQIYASVLMACLLWCTVRGTATTRWLVLAMLLGWIGARLSTSETSYLPILIFSTLGSIVAVCTRTMAGFVIAGLYAGKIIWYTGAVLGGLPGWVLFEVSTLMGWAQIVALMIGHNGGKGSLIKKGKPYVQDGVGLLRSGTGRVFVFIVRCGRVLLPVGFSSKDSGRRRVSGGNQLADRKNR